MPGALPRLEMARARRCRDSAPPTLIDPRSGATYPLEVPRWCGTDGAPLLVSDLPGIGREEIDRTRRSLWRYAAALPVPVARPITLGEGCTPLVEAAIPRSTALLEMRMVRPFRLLQGPRRVGDALPAPAAGITEVLEDLLRQRRGGDRHLAPPAGCAPPFSFLPLLRPPRRQARAMGASIRLIPGSRQDCAEAARAEAERIFYASHNWHPFFLEGTRTLAYELWEDLGFRAPCGDQPCGAGSDVRASPAASRNCIGQGRLPACRGCMRRSPKPAGRSPAPSPRPAGDRPASTPRRRHRPSRSRCAWRNACGVAQTGRRGGAAGGRGDRRRHPRSRPPRLLCRTHRRPGGGGLREAARRGHHRACRDSGGGADGSGSRPRSGMPSCWGWRRERPAHRPVRLQIECNRICSAGGIEAFRGCWLEGQALLADARAPVHRNLGEFNGFAAAMDAAGPWQPVPLLFARAQPDGPVTADAWADIRSRLFAALEAAGAGWRVLRSARGSSGRRRGRPGGRTRLRHPPAHRHGTADRHLRPARQRLPQPGGSAGCLCRLPHQSACGQRIARPKRRCCCADCWRANASMWRCAGCRWCHPPSAC